jgi:hypothetical protein
MAILQTFSSFSSLRPTSGRPACSKPSTEVSPRLTLAKHSKVCSPQGIATKSRFGPFVYFRSTFPDWRKTIQIRCSFSSVVIKSRIALTTHSNQHLLRSNADEYCWITNENDLIITTLRHLLADSCTACHSWSQRRVRELLNVSSEEKKLTGRSHTSHTKN